uniref:REV3 like, DNA directed polymerase zeta catalytic subunit n=1 Tax=Pipistrellus kuhlii TaxID=59472 RepID=A0A7J7YNW9_PIPKU|nr:REV3 like, DNA directed polymerase zeta catalytic subunit [Pipistrellus kuhlii]
MFSVRIVTADYYMASPLKGLDICQSPLTQAPVKKVPVVRVFGATPAGTNATPSSTDIAHAPTPGCRAALSTLHVYLQQQQQQQNYL